MVKLVVLPVLVVLLAMHTRIDAFGLVRVDVQKDNNFANAIGSAISSKIQSWNSILNSLLQVKYSYGGSVSSTSSTSGTGGLNVAPLYQKVVNINSGIPATRPPSGQVAASLDVNDDDNEVTPAAAVSHSPDATVGRAVVTVNKSLIPLVSVSTSQVAAPVASGSESVAVSAAVPSSVGYTYRKRFVSY